MLNFEVPNTLPMVLFCLAAPMGGVDTLYYHMYKFRLYRQPSSRAELVTHLMRGILMGFCVYVLSHYTPSGAWFYVVAGLFISDFINSIADVYLEPKSRAPLGGIPPMEYLIHIIGTTFAGAITMAYFILFWHLKDQPTALEPLQPGALPWWLVIQCQAMVVGAVLITFVDGGLFLKSIFKKEVVI